MIQLPAPTLYLTLCFLMCSACAQFPELDSTVAPDIENASYPALVPFEQLNIPAMESDDAEDPLIARTAALKARAARLRGTVLDTDSRTRLTSGQSTR